MADRTEKQKMLAGELYSPDDLELQLEQLRARELTHRFNQSPPHQIEFRQELLRELFGAMGEDVLVEPPFHCDYGSNIYIEDGVFINFNCVFLDCADIALGRGTMLGPAVQIYAATHPTDAATRASGLELARPVIIGSNVWIGGSAIILPGVTIGDNSVIGAGSVVTRDVPANVVAVGNPCRVLKPLP
jgi:maltose O-acetyltransferase